MAPAASYFEQLGVAPEASLEEIHAAYRQLARKAHPDSAEPGASAAAMQALNDAWFVLRDPVRREDHRRALARDLAESELTELGPAAPGSSGRWLPLLVTAVIVVTSTSLLIILVAMALSSRP